MLIFNTGAPEDLLREENCRANVLHIAPSYSMLADGLAQYLVWKQWKRWFLIKGSHPEDDLYAGALRHAAKKFGAKIVEERTYEDTGGGRRSDSGSVQTQRLIPVATQNAPAYDVLVAADESESLCKLSSLPHMGSASGRGLGRAQANKLGRKP